MKKLTYEEKVRNAWHAQQSWQHDLKRADKRHFIKIQGIAAISAGFSPDSVLQKYNLDAPANFNLNESFEEVVLFLKKLREQCTIRRRSFSVNFKTISELSPIAALVLTAEIDRWRRIRNVKLRPVELRKWNPTVRRLLNEMGFFEILDIENPCTPEDLINDGDLKFIKFFTGNLSDGKLAQELRISLEAVAGPIIAKKALYTGLTEAMSNSVEHAYPPEKLFPSGVYKRWWMAGSFNKNTGRMMVMLYDQGVGIPTTLPLSRFWNFIFGYLSKLNLSKTDANLIKAAMQIGRTKTGLENRGLGLNEMRDFIIRSGNGVLRIISKKGDYVFFSNGKEQTKDQDVSLDGTLIAWEIYTKDEVNE